MSTMAENVIAAGADNRHPMLEKSQYNSWQSRMKLYIRGKEHGKELLDSILHGPFKYGMAVGLPLDVYTLVNHHTDAKEIWDRVKLLIEGTKLTLQERESKLYNEFDRFTSKKGESIHSYYLRFAQLINDIDTIGMTMQKLQVHTKFVNNLQPGRQTQSYADSGARGNATGSGVNINIRTNTTNQAKVVRCYKCQGEGHMARQCIKPKRPKNLEWFKEKMLFAQALEAEVVLDKEHMTFLADDGLTIATGQDTQELTTTAIFQTDDLDAFDSDCDEA
ncbi:retrovirus-related pol polyprotein from transposon TNT 1-94 [Tanacetum coccineum]|uniref:Retrovirus-related pol polyprotein from transposon TNT 1-94 n=1 Tax=Tanacetum coccineum TaxID=301880 RepID=A0ABQ5DRK4_9ASTR